jgi:hypothetical protein
MQSAFILLQSIYFKQNDSGGGLIILAIAVGAIILFSLIQKYLSKGKTGVSKQSSYYSRISPGATYQSASFKRAGKPLGFSREQIAFLDTYAQRFDVRNPEHVLKNAEALDSFLRKVFQSIEASPQKGGGADQRTTMLFQIREYLDQLRHDNHPLSSTHALQRGNGFTFVTEEGDHFSSKVISAEASGISCAIPVDNFGQEIRFQRGAKLTCYLYTGKDETGYGFTTRVMGYLHATGANQMILKHTDKIERLPARLHRRKEISMPCEYSPVTILVERVNGANQRRIVVSDELFKGMLCNLSAGGLSLKTAHDLAEGSYLNLSFGLPSGRLSAIGKILKSNPAEAGGIVSHIQFVKITRKDINKILSFVYNYER